MTLVAWDHPKEGRMKKFAGLMMMVMMFAAALFAGTMNSVAGKWDVVFSGDGHHPPSAVLELEQDGNKIVANLVIPDHGDLPLEGEFVQGKLMLHSTDDAFMKATMAGTLQEDGTFAGNVDTQIG